MVYICGGYEDTVAERSVLMENVYPRLYLYCKQRGYDFRMVDLRGGVCAPVAECHDTVELHVENIEMSGNPWSKLHFVCWTEARGPEPSLYHP
ncbi:NACHT and WD repeat domain containing protein 2 [Dissostichus eleginoides]|uniref:NACHT and WD repeat domain containing protein 2 n=1 Tax=Dissostichus eleginoides TaxID=100907 RepID=A0AAD9BUH0_DISEL|nr:NACHT and WD repeat domain containing protein 2 [Dissostichus eleginoides]